MKIAFQADANLDPDIWRGLRRREPSIDFQDHVGTIPDGMPHPDVLQLAADAGRVLVSADVNTMLPHFTDFVARRESPGLILIPFTRALRQIIEGLLLLWLSGRRANSRIKLCGFGGLPKKIRKRRDKLNPCAGSRS